ncbi:MAG TPA: OBAP family protein [Alphaproteobacteria bacterium]|nr:OBAP family protein [Alphaproteobacteria bacterium]
MWRNLLTIAVMALALVVTLTLAATTPSAPPPGEPKTTSTQVLGLGAALLQSTTPVNQLDLYLNGFHFQHDRLDVQEEAHHYCAQLTEEFAQCAIFDGNGAKAKLIGVEHIVSDRLYRSLPGEDQRLWHPHHYEVKAGLLIAPGIPQAIEHQLMAKLVGTWGKTWHLWHPKHDELPVGQASLMMGFTADGQIQPQILEDRDRRFNVSASELRRQRADIPDPRADAKGEQR